MAHASRAYWAKLTRRESPRKLNQRIGEQAARGEAQEAGEESLIATVGKSMKPIIWAGAVLVLLGLLGIAIPSFTTSQTKDVAKLGDTKIQTTGQSTHVVPTA
jgi:hypothetical protein